MLIKSLCASLTSAVIFTSSWQDVLLSCGAVFRGNCFSATQISHHKMMPKHTAVSSQMSALLILMLFMQLTLFLCKISICRAFYETDYADRIWHLNKLPNFQFRSVMNKLKSIIQLVHVSVK